MLLHSWNLGKKFLVYAGCSVDDNSSSNVTSSLNSAFKSGIELGGITLIPALDINGTFVATWFAHTGFGLPLATFLLRDFMMGLPKSVIESAKIDGASNHVYIF